MSAVVEKIEGLQDGWAEKKLGDLGEYINGRGFKKSEWSNAGLPIIRIQDLTGTGKEQNYYNGEIEDRHVVEPGDLLISWSATLGAYIWKGPKAALNQHIFKVETNINKKLHYYLIQHILDDLYRQAHGSGMVHITKTKFENTPVLIPETEEQQKRIVAKIEELFSHIDAGIEALKKAKQLLKQYRQSVLKAAVTGELTKEWREANKDKFEPASQLLERILKERRQKWEEQQLEQFKVKGKVPKDDKWKSKYKELETVDIEPFVIPDEWCWTSLDTFLHNIEAGKSFKCDERPPNDDETGIVKVSAVTWGEFDSNESKTIIDESKINPNYRIEEGDFLFSRANTIELVGACVIVKHVDKDLLLSDKILRFVMPNEWKEWIQLCLRTQHGRNEIETLATGNQESMRNIAQGSIRKIRLPIAPKAELCVLLRLVAQKIDSITRLENEIDWQLKKAVRNKESILASSFSGEMLAL
jgi:type I restriction enzyme, S subunit